MTRFILRRLAFSLFVLFGVAVAVFLLVHLSGDPVLLMVPVDASPETIAQLRHTLGFDRPLPVQFWAFLSRAVRGDFGESLRYQAPALPLVLERIPATLELAGCALLFSLALAVPLGVACAVWRGTLVDTAGMVLALLGQSIPVFWLGVMLVLTFAVRLHWLPSFGRGGPANLILPSITLGLYLAATVTRLLRSGMTAVLLEDYVRTARAKGLSNRVVIWRHALKNALIPVVTVIGMQVGVLLGGSVITETVFAWPGMGRLMVQAIYNRDLPLVQAAVFVVALVVVASNLIVDLLYGFLDPRIKYS